MKEKHCWMHGITLHLLGIYIDCNQFMVRIDLAVSWLAMLINLSETTRARVWSLGSSTPLHNRTSNHFLYPYHKQCRWVMHWFYLILLVRYLLKSLKSIFFFPRTVPPLLHTDKRARGDFSVCRLNEDINTWTTSPELLWESLHEHFYHLIE